MRLQVIIMRPRSYLLILLNQQGNETISHRYGLLLVLSHLYYLCKYYTDKLYTRLQLYLKMSLIRSYNLPFWP